MTHYCPHPNSFTFTMIIGQIIRKARNRPNTRKRAIVVSRQRKAIFTRNGRIAPRKAVARKCTERESSSKKKPRRLIFKSCFVMKRRFFLSSFRLSDFRIMTYFFNRKQLTFACKQTHDAIKRVPNSSVSSHSLFFFGTKMRDKHVEK